MSKQPPDEIRARMESFRGFYLEELGRDSLRDAGCLQTVMVLPADFNERVRILGNMLAQMASKEIADDSLRMLAGKLSHAFSYLLNSHSWQSKTLFDFDLEEIKRKLGRLAR